MSDPRQSQQPSGVFSILRQNRAARSGVNHANACAYVGVTRSPRQTLQVPCGRTWDGHRCAGASILRAVPCATTSQSKLLKAVRFPCGSKAICQYSSASPLSRSCCSRNFFAMYSSHASGCGQFEECSFGTFVRGPFGSAGNGHGGYGAIRVPRGHGCASPGAAGSASARVVPSAASTCSPPWGEDTVSNPQAMRHCL